MRQSLTVKISGVNCGGCLSRIDRALQVHGAKRVDYDFATSKAKIKYIGESSYAITLCNAIEKSGYHAVQESIEEEEE